MADGYLPFLNKTEAQVEEAQRKLVHHSLHAALGMLYQFASNHRIQIPREVYIHKAHVFLTTEENGESLDTPEQMLAAIEVNFPDQFTQMRAYNLLAKSLGFDLSLKTSGHKSIESIEEKMTRRGLEIDQIQDIVRVTAVSRDIDALEHFKSQFKHRILAEESKTDSSKDFNYKVRPWMMTKTGIMKEGIYTKIDDIAAEILLVPREQARVAARISHIFYEVVRSWDAYTQDKASYEETPTQRKREMPEALKAKRAAVVDLYNSIADMANTLGNEKPLDPNYFRKVNNLLLTINTNSLTFDENSEGALLSAKESDYKKVQKKMPYSDIFKTSADLLRYRDYIYSAGRKIAQDSKPMLPLPRLNVDDADAKINQAVVGLTLFTLVTHACYMQHATPEMRSRWLELAVEVNHKSRVKMVGNKEKPDNVIPLPILESMAQGANGAQIIPIPQYIAPHKRSA